MLPDFRELKDKLERSLTLRLRAQVRGRDPVLAMIKIVKQHEGRRHVYSTAEGRERSTNYQPTAAEITINQHETVNWGMADILKHVDGLADQLIGKILPNMFATLREVTNETGNIVDAGGKPFSFELFLESIEKVQIEFNDVTGDPELPTMLVDPTLFERIRGILPEWERNEEYKARYRALIARKRSDWDARESNRKLVD